MCDRNFLSSGFVGSLLNFSTQDFYFPNLRSNGVQSSELNHISYGRREVCSTPWTSPNPCSSPPQSRTFSSFSQPFLATSVSLSTNPNTHNKGPLEEAIKYFSLQDANHKPEESVRHGPSSGSEHGIIHPTCAAKYNFYNMEGQSQPSTAQLEQNSSNQANIAGFKEPVNSNVTVQPNLSGPCVRASLTDGMRRQSSTSSTLYVIFIIVKCDLCTYLCLNTLEFSLLWFSGTGRGIKWREHDILLAWKDRVILLFCFLFFRCCLVFFTSEDQKETEAVRQATDCRT